MLGVGIDWAEAFHDIALGTPEKGVIQQFRIEHSLAGVERLITRCLVLEPDPAEVRVVLEARHGLLVEALVDAGFVHCRAGQPGPGRAASRAGAQERRRGGRPDLLPAGAGSSAPRRCRALMSPHPVLPGERSCPHPLVTPVISNRSPLPAHHRQCNSPDTIRHRGPRWFPAGPPTSSDWWEWPGPSSQVGVSPPGGRFPGRESPSAVRNAPKRSISRHSSRESSRGDRVQVIGPRGVTVGGSSSMPVIWCTWAGQGSLTPYRSPVSTIRCSGVSG